MPENINVMPSLSNCASVISGSHEQGHGSGVEEDPERALRSKSGFPRAAPGSESLYAVDEPQPPLPC